MIEADRLQYALPTPLSSPVLPPVWTVGSSCPVLRSLIVLQEVV